MRVEVPRPVLLHLVLRYGEIHKIGVGVLIPLLEGLDENEGVALYVKAVLGDGIGGGDHLAYPIPPVPKLHRYLLVLQPRVVEVRIPAEIEGGHLASISELGHLLLPINGIDRRNELLCEWIKRHRILLIMLHEEIFRKREGL